MAERAIGINISAGAEPNISADDHAALFHALAGGDGELSEITCTRISDNLVRLSAGDVLVQGHQLRVPGGSTHELAVESGTLGMNRNDLVVAQYVRRESEEGSDTLEFAVVKGTPTAGEASDPELVQENIDNPAYTTRQIALFRLPIVETTLGTPVKLVNLVDNLARLAAVEGDIKTGWIPAGETWTRTSANTFTVAGDVTGKYGIGDKIRCHCGGTKAFYIINVAYAEGTTTVTVSPGVVYPTMAPTTLTVDITANSNYYSKIENPQGFPGWFSYNPSYGASGSMTYTNVVTSYAKFRISGECGFLKVRASGTTGGSASTYITVSLPFAAYTGIGGSGAVLITDSGVGGGFGHMDGSNANFRIYKNDASNWGLGATKGFWLDAFYFIK